MSENDANKARLRRQYYWYYQKWQTWLDRKVEEAIGDGNVSNLRGAGKPLDLGEDDAQVPEEMRLAYKVMRDHDVTPAWVGLGRELAAEREKILRFAENAARNYQQRLYDARVAGSFLLEREAGERWQAACERIQQRIQTYNNNLLTFNTALPPQVPQRVPLDYQRELEHAIQVARQSKPGT